MNHHARGGDPHSSTGRGDHAARGATRARRALAATCLALAVALAGCGDDAADQKSLLATDVPSDPYLVQFLVPGSDFLSIHGLAFDAKDRLFVGSVMGQAVYEVDVATGASKVAVGPPQGMADDVAIGPDGTMVWTSILTGKVHARRPSGEVVMLADNMPGINSVNFRADGRLFVTQVLWADVLSELDVQGRKPPRKVAEGMGHLNGFDFASDGHLYGPLMYKGKVVKVDVDSGKVTTVAAGFTFPVAVNIDSRDNLYVPDTALGQVFRVDIHSGEKTLVASVDAGTDNLAINSRDELFITNMVDNALYQINTRNGGARTIVKSRLSVPGGLDVITDNGVDQVLLGDLFAFRRIDGNTGAVHDLKRALRDKMELPMSVNVEGGHAVTSSWFAGGVEVLDVKTNASIASFHGFKFPVDALELAPGVVLVAEQGTGNLVEVSGEHGEDREVVAEDLPGMAAMRRIPDSTKWVYLTDVVNGQLLKVKLGSGKREVIADGLVQPEGFDVAPDGSIVLAEVGKRRIVRIDPDDGEVTEIARNLAIGYPAAEGTPPGYIMTGVGVSASGAIYVASDLNTALYKIVATPKH